MDVNSNRRAKTQLAPTAWIGFALVAATLATAAACARPKDLDLSLSRATDHNVFRIELGSEAKPIPISRLHQWSIHLSAADGAPISGAILTVDGGMPEHHHGLPTAPRVEAAATPGDYVIRGMKFSMTGWWVLNVNVAAPDGSADKVTFNVVL